MRQGGSTLTQQLMKNFFLTSKRDWHRKVKEALMAYIAERQYSKDEILENYINDIYLGQRGQEGIYGIWEASEFYFSKEPRDLTIAEMATIAGMISSPNRLNPLRHPELAEQRRNEVLPRCSQDGYISKAAYDSAATEPLHPREVFTETNDAPYFVDYVKHELAERYPPTVLDRRRAAHLHLARRACAKARRKGGARQPRRSRGAATPRCGARKRKINSKSA